MFKLDWFYEEAFVSGRRASWLCDGRWLSILPRVLPKHLALLMTLPDYRIRNQREAALWYCVITQHRRTTLRRRRTGNCLMVLFNVLLAAFTGGLVFLGWWQIRAYIQPAPLIIPNFALSPLVAPISITDTGATPAYRVDAKVWCAVATPNWTEPALRNYELKHPAAGHSNTTIFPHSSQFGVLCPGNLTPDQVREITTNEGQLFLFGTIGYRTLSMHRYSNFCFHLSGEDWKKQLWSACQFYNDAN